MGVLPNEQKENLWDIVFASAVFYSEERSKILRDSQRRLIKLNEDIAKYATKLSLLIEERCELSEKNSLSSYEDIHVVDWISRAAENNYQYEYYVKKELELFAGRFDLKYWPSTSEIVGAIAEFAEEAEVEGAYGITREFISSRKASKADHLKVLLKGIEEGIKYGDYNHKLPSDFGLTDKSLATLMNVMLDLGAMVSAEYIKRTRKNIRDSKLSGTT